MTKKFKLKCENCGVDITDLANKAAASRAGLATMAKHGKEHYQKLALNMNEKKKLKKLAALENETH